MKKWILIILILGLATTVFIWKKNSSESIVENDSNSEKPAVKVAKISYCSTEEGKKDEKCAIQQVEIKKMAVKVVASPINEKSEEEAAVEKALEVCELSNEVKNKLGNLTQKSKELLAKNVFFSKDGENFVLRTFIKDSESTSYTQLVLVKLGEEEGMGEVQPISKENQRNPSEEILATYLEGGDVSRIDSDQRWILTGGEELLISFEGDQVAKIMLYADGGEPLCEKNISFKE